MIVQDVQARYPSAMVPSEGFDAFHELIYLDELAAVGPGGRGAEPPPHCLGSLLLGSLLCDFLLKLVIFWVNVEFHSPN